MVKDGVRVAHVDPPEGRCVDWGMGVWGEALCVAERGRVSRLSRQQRTPGRHLVARASGDSPLPFYLAHTRPGRLRRHCGVRRGRTTTDNKQILRQCFVVAARPGMRHHHQCQRDADALQGTAQDNDRRPKSLKSVRSVVACEKRRKCMDGQGSQQKGLGSSSDHLVAVATLPSLGGHGMYHNLHKRRAAYCTPPPNHPALCRARVTLGNVLALQYTVVSALASHATIGAVAALIVSCLGTSGRRRCGLCQLPKTAAALVIPSALQLSWNRSWLALPFLLAATIQVGGGVEYWRAELCKLGYTKLPPSYKPAFKPLTATDIACNGGSLDPAWPKVALCGGLASLLPELLYGSAAGLDGNVFVNPSVLTNSPYVIGDGTTAHGHGFI